MYQFILGQVYIVDKNISIFSTCVEYALAVDEIVFQFNNIFIYDSSTKLQRLGTTIFITIIHAIYRINTLCIISTFSDKDYSFAGCIVAYRNDFNICCGIARKKFRPIITPAVCINLDTIQTSIITRQKFTSSLRT